MEQATPSELVAIVRAVTPKAKAEAKERQRLSGGRGKRSAKFADLKKGDARTTVAARIGKSYSSLSHASAIMRELTPKMKAEAKERQRAHGGTAPERKNTSANFAEVSKGDAREAVAKRIGKSYGSLSHAAKVVDAAEAEQRPRQRHGSSQRTRRPRRCAASARSSGAKLGSVG